MEITGRITADALVSDVRGGKSMVNFSIAINDSYRSGVERKRVTTYVRCAWWLNTGIAAYLKKGLLVGLYGRMTPEAYIGRGGQAVGTLRFTASDIRFLGGNAGHGNGDGSGAAGVSGQEKPAADDDLPF